MDKKYKKQYRKSGDKHNRIGAPSGNYYRVSIKQVAPSPLFGDWDGT